MYERGVVRVPSRAFTSAAIKAVLARGNFHGAAANAEEENEWAVSEVLKSTVAAGHYSPGSLGDKAASDFSAEVFAESVVGRIPNVYSASFDVPIPTAATPAAGAFVQEGHAIPLVGLGLGTATVSPRKIGSISVLTDEVVRDPRAEVLVGRILRGGLARAADTAFLDAANSGSASTPKSPFNGAPHVSGSTNPSADLAQLIEIFPGDLSTASFIASPNVFARLALHRDSGGASSFPDISARGGTLLGLPAIASRFAPDDSNGGSLFLIDGTALAVAQDLPTLDSSTAAALQMLDNPTNASSDGTATNMVSLFGSNSVAVRIRWPLSWVLLRAGAAYVSGASW